MKAVKHNLEQQRQKSIKSKLETGKGEINMILQSGHCTLITLTLTELHLYVY